MDLLSKIRARKAKIGVIGLGYVGLPLAMEFCRAGFDVTGFDIDDSKVKALRAGKSYINYIPDARIKKMRDFTPTSDFAGLGAMDCIIICVPTPVTEHRVPDLSFVLNTTRVVRDHLKKGQLVVLESTTYPGTTDEDMRHILESNGLRAGRDFYLANSPEREDPNRKDYNTHTIPKVVGGYTPRCLKVAVALYDEVIVRTVPVSSTKAAEATKLLENIYRAINIALVNELKVLFDRMGIDVWEVIDAAATKPFGFQAFYPGPGLGGHCIPVDPFYLTWKAKEFDMQTRFIELAGEINSHMPYYVVFKTMEALNERGKTIKGARVLLLGLSYKRDSDDTRESPSFKLIEILEKRGVKIDYNDPHVPVAPKKRKYHFKKTSVPLTAANLKKYDCVLISTDHSAYDPEFIAKHSNLVVDTRNLLKGKLAKRKNVKRA